MPGPRPGRAQLRSHPRSSTNPYSLAAFTKARSAPATVSLGVLLLMVSGITLMYGSVGSWVKVTGAVGGAAVFHASINGIDPGISTLIGLNGYVTFIGGIVLLVFAGLAMTNDDGLLAILTPSSRRRSWCSPSTTGSASCRSSRK